MTDVTEEAKPQPQELSKVIVTGTKTPPVPASKPESPSVLDWIMNPGSSTGTVLAQRNMTAESVRLAQQMGAIKDGSRGMGVRECVVDNAKRIVFNGPKTALCKPTEEGVAREIGEEVKSRVLGAVKGSAGRVVTEAFNGASSALEIQNNHKDAIKILAEQGHPGMSYNERVVEGMKIRTWADATGAGLYPDDPKVKSYVSIESMTGDTKMDTRQRSAVHRAATESEFLTANKALESVQNYVGEHGHEALKEKLEDAPNTLAEAHRKEQDSVLAFRESNRPTREKSGLAPSS